MRQLHPDQLLTFSAVIAHASFSLAAEQLGLSQPAVSRQVKELERRLQLRLAERVGRRVQPTAAGTELLVHAERIRLALADAEAALQAFTQTAGGTVRIGAGATACIHLLPPLLGRLKRANPALDIAVSTGNTPEILRRVEQNQLDAALVTLPAAGRSLEVTPVLEDRFVAIAPPALAGSRRQATPRWLAQQPLVLFEAGAHTRSLCDAWFARAGLRVKPAMELGSVEAMKQMVAAGLGCAVLPALGVARPANRRGLVVLELSPRTGRTLAWVLRRDKPLTRALRQVHDAILGLAAGAAPAAR